MAAAEEMCIRDSLQFERRRRACPVFQFVDLEALAADGVKPLGRFVPDHAVCRAESVSYTHLDVYKRQERDPPFDMLYNHTHGDDRRGEQGAPQPVSYTHLDVYKRQSFDIRSPFAGQNPSPNFRVVASVMPRF